MKIRLFIFFSFLLFCSACRPQQSLAENSNVAFKNVNELKRLHDEYLAIRYDHKEADQELFAFEKEMEILLNDRSLSNVFLDSVIKTEKIFTERSEDDKLLISSWEVIDFGCNHWYRSILRYKDENNFHIEYHSGIKNELYPLDDVIKTYPYKIHMVENAKYLIEGTRLTCQAGRIIEFDILEFKNGKLNSPNFKKGYSELTYIATRSDTIYPSFDSNTKTLSVPIREPIINEGEDTGFTRVTEETEKFKYIEGVFVLQKP